MKAKDIEKVLVTGGAGFIGSHVAEFYAKEGNEVIVFDNFSRAEILGKSVGDPLYNWSYLKNNYPNIRLIKGDIRSFKEIKQATEEIDTIIHTAAQVAVTTSLNDPRTDFEINAIGTLNVLEAARLNDAVVIMCSTNKVYGENVNKIPVIKKETRYEYADPKYREGIPETFPIDLTGHSPYGCSKLVADIYTQDYAYTYGLKTCVFRLSCIYGERQFGVEDQGWIAWFTIATITGKSITIYGDGKQVRDVLYIDDLINAFDAFLQRKNQLSGEVFNIGGGPKNTLSLLELLNILEQLTGKRSRMSFSDWRPSDQKVYISNISKAKEKLNWAPKVGPRKGVERLVNWVLDNKYIFI
jgi:CDP-paratose 2-epimerase